MTTTQSKVSADIFIDYCGIIQNIAEQCWGIFTADIYLKIFEDTAQNDFDEKILHFFRKYL